MGLILNKFTAEGFTPSQYEETPEGFLRVKARVLAERVMPYARHELQDIPSELAGVEPIMMLVSASDMSATESMRTLEGAAVVAPDHQWIETDTLDFKKGNTAGSPVMDGPYLAVDLLVTDPEAVQNIKDRKIGEISGAYTAASVFENGEHDGQIYHAKQTGLRWNHVAIIPYGTGRAGTDVRIINHKAEILGGKKMGVRVKLANTGKFINVDSEEDANAIGVEQDAAEKKVDTAKGEGMEQGKEMSGPCLEAAMKEATELKEQMAALQAQLDEALGELSVYKEQLDILLSDETMEAQVETQAADSGEADEIIENHCAMLDDKAAAIIRSSFQRIGNTSIHKLRGTSLHEAVLTAVGMKTENMSPGELKGAFRARHHMANTAPKLQVKTVAGVKLFNQAENNQPSPQRMVNSMWGKKEQK